MLLSGEGATGHVRREKFKVSVLTWFISQFLSGLLVSDQYNFGLI